MPTSRSWDGCVAIPGTEIAVIMATFVFVIVIVIVGTALKISGADIGAILLAAGSIVGAVFGAAGIRRRRGGGGFA